MEVLRLGVTQSKQFASVHFLRRFPVALFAYLLNTYGDTTHMKNTLYYLFPYPLHSPSYLTSIAKYTMFTNMGLLDYLKKRELKRLGEDRYILCLDGGGMRGVIPATLLGHIETLLRNLGDDRPLYSHFDLIAGTSTG